MVGLTEVVLTEVSVIQWSSGTNEMLVFIIAVLLCLMVEYLLNFQANNCILLS